MKTLAVFALILSFGSVSFASGIQSSSKVPCLNNSASNAGLTDYTIAATPNKQFVPFAPAASSKEIRK